jgi:hypothetical protein
MNDTEIIAMQARKIADYEVEMAQYVDRIRRIRLQLICTGAPLNDNFLQYSKEQLKPFFKIQDITDGCTD